MMSSIKCVPDFISQVLDPKHPSLKKRFSQNIQKQEDEDENDYNTNPSAF